MAIQPTLYYEMYIDGLQLPYNPENLKFHHAERESAEHALTQVPAVRYGLPPTVETLTFDVRIPRNGDQNYFKTSLKSAANLGKNTKTVRLEMIDIRGTLTAKMRSRMPVEVEIIRFYHPLLVHTGREESLNIQSLASTLPNIGQRGQSTHKEKYTITSLEIDETATSWFDSTIHVELQKYYRAPRLVGVGVYRENGPLMSFSPMGEVDPRTGKLRRRVYTNTSGLGGIYETLKSLWDSGTENETLTEKLHRYYSNLRSLTQYTVAELQNTAGFVTPFISGITGVLSGSLSWSSLIGTGLSCIPGIGPVAAALPALYSTATSIFSGLGSAVSTVASWVTGGSRSAYVPLPPAIPEIPANSLVNVGGMYWGSGWNREKHMEYIPNAPTCELPLKIGVELPPVADLLRDADGYDTGTPQGGDF